MINQEINIRVVVRTFRVTTHTNVKVVSILVPNVLDQILCIPESSLDHFPGLLLTRRVTTQGQDVGATGLVGSMEGIIHLSLGHVRAGKMHAGFQSVHGLGHIDHLAGQVRQSTTGTPSDIDKRGA